MDFNALCLIEISVEFVSVIYSIILIVNLSAAYEKIISKKTCAGRWKASSGK